MSELKTCPFCGSCGDELGLCKDNYEPLNKDYWFVRCYVCHVETVHSDTEAEAIAAWNRRAAPTASGDERADFEAAASERFGPTMVARADDLVQGDQGSYTERRIRDAYFGFKAGRASLPAAEVQTWLPIATAPKSVGVLVWADWKSEVCFGKFQTKKRGVFSMPGWTLTFRNGYKLHGERAPTHWMPLPAAPSTERNPS